MHFHVRFQLVSSNKGFSTLITSEKFLPCMKTKMDSPVWWLKKRLGANAAAAGFLSCVRSHMRLQTATVEESFWTKRTTVCFHYTAFLLVWVLRWARKWFDWENVLLHWGQRRCFFLECFPVWLLRRPSLSKDSEHSGHLNEFLAESSFAAVRALSEVSSLLCSFASAVKQFNEVIDLRLLNPSLKFFV